MSKMLDTADGWSLICQNIHIPESTHFNNVRYSNFSLKFTINSTIMFVLSINRILEEKCHSKYLYQKH